MLFSSMRRGFPRYPAQKIASYHYGGKRYLTLTLDLGLGGMKIKTNQDLPEGEHLDFKLVLGDSSIWVKGRIAYSGFLADKQSVSGIQFIDISSQADIVLRNYLADSDEVRAKHRRVISAAGMAGTDMSRREAVEKQR